VALKVLQALQRHDQRLLLFDALSTEFSEVTLRRDPNCPVCGEHPTITEYIDYVEFCSGSPANTDRPAHA